MEKLNLSNNNIAAVRSDFKQLKDLSELKLQHNKIKDIPEFILEFRYVIENPAAIETMFSNNEISMLRQPFLDAMGSELRFTNNYLTKMPIFQLSKDKLITLIDFSGNKIT
jgi:Leucine-rich repeat (LRR) protein